MAHSATQCLAVLGLSPGATRSEIKEAYRDLAKVWHPDRFGGDERLRIRAEEKLKAINAAYHALSSSRPTMAATASSAAPGTNRTQTAQDRPRQRPATSSGRAGHGATNGPSRSVVTRRVRMDLPGVHVQFGARHGRLVNLSITGGQLCLGIAPAVGSRATLTLAAPGHTLRLESNVVRVTRGESLFDDPAFDWTVGFRFVDPSSEDQRAIQRFYGLLLTKARATRAAS